MRKAREGSVRSLGASPCRRHAGCVRQKATVQTTENLPHVSIRYSVSEVGPVFSSHDIF